VNRHNQLKERYNERGSSSLCRHASGIDSLARSGTSGWQELARHFEDGIIDSIFGCRTTPERVFVGVTHDGLYRTIDGGKSWARVLEGDIHSVTVDPTDDKVIYSGIEPVASIAARTAATNGKNSMRFNTCPRPFAITGGFRSHRIRAISVIFSSIPTTRVSFIFASNMAASCAVLTAARAGKTLARASII
jgi:hypothetical protein